MILLTLDLRTTLQGKPRNEILLLRVCSQCTFQFLLRILMHGHYIDLYKIYTVEEFISISNIFKDILCVSALKVFSLKLTWFTIGEIPIPWFAFITSATISVFVTFALSSYFIAKVVECTNTMAIAC